MSEPGHSVDLPDGVLAEMVREGTGAHQMLMTLAKGGFEFTSELLRAITLKQLNQVDPLEAQANRTLRDAT